MKSFYKDAFFNKIVSASR